MNMIKGGEKNFAATQRKVESDHKFIGWFVTFTGVTTSMAK